MNLIELLRGDTIEGLTQDELESIFLNGSSGAISIRSRQNGLIILNNNKIIRCVNTYYERRDGKAFKANTANPCHIIHQQFDVPNVPAYSCDLCHRRCMENKKQGKLSMKPKKSSTKRRK